MCLIFFPFGIALAQSSAPKSWQVAAPATISEDTVAKDVTCNHSQLSILAEVTGQVFAVGCNLMIGKNSLLHRGVVFSGGILRIEEGANIFGDIVQIGGELSLDPGANLSGVVQRYQESLQPPGVFMEASQRYLTFPRIVPDSVDHLTRAAKELRLRKIQEKSTQPLESFKIKGFLEFLFQKEQIRFAQKWTYDQEKYLVELQIIEFQSKELALRFWKNILTFTNLNMEHSVENSLGEGGHWAFRYQNMSTLMWHRNSWLIAAHVIIDDTPTDGIWSNAEKQRDRLVEALHKSIIANTNQQDSGDTYIGSALTFNPF